MDSEDDSNGNVSIFDFYNGTEHYSFDLVRKHTMDDVLEWLYSGIIGADSIVFAHNLEYDIINLTRYHNYAHIGELNYTSRLMTAKLRGLNNIEFWDSFNYYAGSLRSMGDIVGISKGHFDDVRENQDENIKYCQIDTSILWHYIEKFQKILLEDAGVSLAPTIGKMSMDVWRSNFLNREYKQVNDSSILDAFYGGRTEVFRIGKFKGEIVVADVKSMYPDRMKNCKYPDTSTLEPSLISTHQYGIGKFEIFVPKMEFPPLPIHYAGKLLFPTGSITGSWTYAEVRNALSYGCHIISESKGIGTNVTCQPFVGYVNKYYGLRQECKEPFLNSYYKNLLNNLFGKFAQHNAKITLTCLDSPPEKGMILKRQFANLNIWEGEGKAGMTANYIWGAYITSYARIKELGLLYSISKAGHYVLYCDTDSCFYLKRNNNIPYTVGNSLGLIGEKKYAECETITAKGYILIDEHGTKSIACKGIPTEHRLEFFDYGVATFKRPTKLRESLVQDVVANVWRDVTKHDQNRYSKRTVFGDSNVTVAWDFQDLEMINNKQ